MSEEEVERFCLACQEVHIGPWDDRCWKLDEIDRKWDIPGSLR